MREYEFEWRSVFSFQNLATPDHNLLEDHLVYSTGSSATGQENLIDFAVSLHFLFKEQPYSKYILGHSRASVLAAVLTFMLIMVLCPTAARAAPSAGIAWHKEVGDYGITITKPHVGYAGPKVGTRSHVNIVFFRRNPDKKYLNVHHSQYQAGTKSCFYDWDSEARKVVFDQCFDPWKATSIGAAVGAGAIIAAAIAVGWNAIVAAPELVGALAFA